LALYALERHQLPTAQKILTHLVHHLQEHAHSMGTGLAWFTPSDSNDGHYDTGVAHGTAGVLVILARIAALGILPELSSKLMQGAASWLLSLKRNSHSNKTLFPQYVKPNGKHIDMIYGWCHGDIGIAAALLAASQYSGETKWQDVAIETALHTIEPLRQHFIQSDYLDPTLCHGTAGIGHICNRFYQLTGDTGFKDEACTWLEWAINSRKPGTGIAGFSRMGFTEGRELNIQYDPGFISGAAGIGLALLSAISNTPPHWDRLMLIS
jgi:lantibiotic modifying enzyme